jgi:hypothetical protein
MGFDEDKIRMIREPMCSDTLRITSVRRADDVGVIEVDGESFARTERSLDELSASHVFEAHPGWRGHVERR